MKTVYFRLKKIWENERSKIKVVFLTLAKNSGKTKGVDECQTLTRCIFPHFILEVKNKNKNDFGFCLVLWYRFSRIFALKFQNKTLS